MGNHDYYETEEEIEKEIKASKKQELMSNWIEKAYEAMSSLPADKVLISDIIWLTENNPDVNSNKMGHSLKYHASVSHVDHFYYEKIKNKYKEFEERGLLEKDFPSGR